MKRSLQYFKSGTLAVIFLVHPGTDHYRMADVCQPGDFPLPVTSSSRAVVGPQPQPPSTFSDWPVI